MSTIWCTFCASFRQQCTSNPLSCSALALAVILWVIPLVEALVVDNKPIAFLGGDKVEPSIVKPGSTVSVTRSIQYKLNGSGTVTRKLRTAGCVENCTEIELDSGSISFSRGDVRVNNTKIHWIPNRTPAGMWDLKFTLTTRNFLGQPVVTEFPTLTIEVVK